MPNSQHTRIENLHGCCSWRKSVSISITLLNKEFNRNLRQKAILPLEIQTLDFILSWTSYDGFHIGVTKLWRRSTRARHVPGYWYFCGIATWVRQKIKIKKKKKESITLMHKYYIVSILSLVLPLINSLKYLSFILFLFQCWILILFILVDVGLYPKNHLITIDIFYYSWLLLNSRIFENI